MADSWLRGCGSWPAGWIPARTNRDRARLRAKEKYAGTRVTPLVELGAWVHQHSRSVLGAPRALLEGAFIHAEKRLQLTYARPLNARTRATIRWLGRWLAIINEELSAGKARNPGEGDRS